MSNTLKPRQEIRRFDVFAEYNKLKELKKGRPLDEAKGYGLWIAKVVAARRFGAGTTGAPKGEERKEGEEPEEERKFRSLSGEEQTDEMFDKEIVNRMGKDFYHDVFAPEIEKHFEAGDKYESIRDTIRKQWKPKA